MSKLVKIVITILAYVVLTVIGFYTLIIFGMAGSNFYVNLTLVVYFLILAFIPLALFRVLSPRTSLIVGLSLLGGVVISVAARESYRAYHNSFERIYENNVRLSRYEPFADSTLAARLDEPSTLRLTDSLPMLDGATALYPVYAAFAQAVYPEKEYSAYSDVNEVECRTTPYAYEALIEGFVDMIFVLQPSQRQLDYAAYHEVEMVFTPIGKEAFVFFVNRKNKVNGLSVDQLRDIYTGRTTRWSEVGGRNRQIRAFQREEDSGSQTAFLKFMEGYDVMEPPLDDRIYGMGPIVRMAADYQNYPNAIGFTFRHYAESMVGDKGIKLLSIDGVFPTIQTIANGEYPLTFDLYAVTRSDNTNPNVDRLLEWILSPQGQSLVEKSGYNAIFPTR